jgi:hypothetical protein
MPEIDDISVRLTVLETVVRQLVTHLAVRADDPAGWVRTRKVLAERVVDGAWTGPLPPSSATARLHEAVGEFFDPVEDVIESYALHGEVRTNRSPRR